MTNVGTPPDPAGPSRTGARLPQALVIGAPKAGTTTLCATLMRHPGIWMYPRKETHFFNDHYDTRGLEWYRGLFADAPPGALVMEGTPDYAMSHCVDKTMARIAAHIPQARLIFMVRDPVDRIESHYVQRVSNHRTLVPLQKALKRWPEIIGSSDYPALMATVHRYFPPEQVLVLFLDDYIADRTAVHQRVLAFLDLPDVGQDVLDAMAAQPALHRRKDQGMDRPLLARLRQSRHFDRINMALPRFVVRGGTRLLRRKIDVASTLAPQDRARLTTQFAASWAKFQNDFRD